MSFRSRWTRVAQQRLDKDERGFTVIEVMASLIILSVGLVSLAYTANLGFQASARARQDKAATLVADAVLAKMASLDAGIVRDGMYSGDSTLSSDTHIVASTCESNADAVMPCDGEALVLEGASSSPLNPHRTDPDVDHPEQIVGPTSFTVYRYVTDVSTNLTDPRNNLFRLTALVVWDDGSESRTFSYLYDTVSGSIAGATIVENIDAEGSIATGTIGLTGVLSSGAFDSASITLPSVNANVVSSPNAGASARRTTLGASITASGAATTPSCGGVDAEVSVTSGGTAIDPKPDTATDTYCIDSSASGSKVARPTTTPGTSTYLALNKGWTDGPATDAASAEMEEAGTTCDGTADGQPCSKATDEAMGLGSGTSDRFATAVLGLWSQVNTVNRGTCDFVRVFDPTSGSSTSSAMVDRDLDVDAETNNVTVTVRRALPTVAVGCFPAAVQQGTATTALSGSLSVGTLNTAVVDYPLIGTVGGTAATPVPRLSVAKSAGSAYLTFTAETNPSGVAPGLAGLQIQVDDEVMDFKSAGSTGTKWNLWTDTTTSHAVNSGIKIPATGTFLWVTETAGTVAVNDFIKAGTEWMKVTAIVGPASSRMFTVQRAQRSTAAVLHIPGESVYLDKATPTVVNLSVNEFATPPAFPFVVKIDSEQFNVTNRTGAANPRTYQATRAWNSTTPAAHGAGSTVSLSSSVVTVSESAGAQTATPFNIIIGSEEMTVTGRTASAPNWNYTVTRAVNGTTAAAHLAADPVTGGFLPTSYQVNGSPQTWNRAAFDTPPAVSGWVGGGFLVRLRNVVETITVEAGTGASVPTYTRTGYLDYWDGSGYQTTALSTSPTTYSVPVLKWVANGSTSANSTSMCLGAEATATAVGSAVSNSAYGASVAAGAAPTPSTSSPIKAASATGASSLFPPSMYFHMANSSATCTANGTNEAVAHINVSPSTGAMSGTATYVQTLT